MSNQQSSLLISLQKDGLYLLDLNETTSSKLDLPFTLPARNKPVCILHCRGMLCLTLEGNNELAIWNPISKEFIKRIPMVEPGQTTNLLGFGYDQVSDNYKIVTVINSKTYIYAFKKSCSKESSWKGSCSKESSWRESKRNPCVDCKYRDRAGTTVDHCMYWIANRSHTRPLEHTTILCFDFVNEKYQEVFYPMHGKAEWGSWLSVLNGEICIIDHYPALCNDVTVWHPAERKDNKIKGWKSSDPWTYMNGTLKELQSSGLTSIFKKKSCVRFACIARNNEIFIVVKGKGNGKDKVVMVYNVEEEKFIEVPFGSSLKGFRCMTNYISQ